jgi:hypothetical protein
MTQPPVDLDFPHAPELEALWTWTRRQPWADAELRQGMIDFMDASAATVHAAARQQQDLRFLDWFHLDRPVAVLGATPLQAWITATGGAPDQPLARTVVGAYEVKRVVPHSLVVLVALADGREFRLKDKALSVGLRKGQLTFGRLYPDGERWVTGASLLAVDADIAYALRAKQVLAAAEDGLSLEWMVYKV